MELSGSYFIYDNMPSWEYDLLFVNAETDRMVSLAGDIDLVTIFNKQGKRNYLIGENYKDASISFPIEVMTDNDRPIPAYARRGIEKWLFGQRNYKKLYLSDPNCVYQDEFDAAGITQNSQYLNCVFRNPEKLEGNGGVIGYRFDVVCDSALAWEDPTICKFDFNDRSPSKVQSVLIDVNTDLKDYVYPKVTIKMGSIGGDVRVINMTDSASRSTLFTGITPNITFTINGNGINYISGDNYKKFSLRNFPRLLDGTNTISVTGDVESIEFEFQNQRYL